MNLYDVLPWIAAGLMAALVLFTAGGGGARKGSWLLPAVLCLVFLGWSVFTILSEGVLGFWTEHTRNAWGNQIWFDLLIAMGVAWMLLLPRIRAAGMRPLPWGMLVLASGGIGLLAMLARYLYLRDRAAAPVQI